MATFSETCALTYRKYVSAPGISNLNLLEKLRSFRSHSSVIYFRKITLDKRFHSFFSPKELLVATVSETCALTS